MKEIVLIIMTIFFGLEIIIVLLQTVFRESSRKNIKTIRISNPRSFKVIDKLVLRRRIKVTILLASVVVTLAIVLMLLETYFTGEYVTFSGLHRFIGGAIACVWAPLGVIFTLMDRRFNTLNESLKTLDNRFYAHTQQPPVQP